MSKEPQSILGGVSSRDGLLDGHISLVGGLASSEGHAPGMELSASELYAAKYVSVTTVQMTLQRHSVTCLQALSNDTGHEQANPHLGRERRGSVGGLGRFVNGKGLEHGLQMTVESQRHSRGHKAPPQGRRALHTCRAMLFQEHDLEIQGDDSVKNTKLTKSVKK